MQHVPRASQRHPTSQVRETKNRGLEWLATADGHVRRSLQRKVTKDIGCRWLDSFDEVHWKTALVFFKRIKRIYIYISKSDPRSFSFLSLSISCSGSKVNHWQGARLDPPVIWGPFQIPKEEVSSIPPAGIKDSCFFWNQLSEIKTLEHHC